MNPYYYHMKDLPDSQPFFTEAEEDTISDSNAENDNEYSQSLISSKKRYRNVVDSSPVKVDLDYTDLSTKVLGANSETSFPERDLTDVEPLLTEAKKDTFSVTADGKTKKRKTYTEPNNELIINPSNNSRTNENSSSAVTVDCSNTNVLEANSKKFSNEQKAKSETESDLHLQNGDNEPSVTCIHCIFDKELDKRNYYFGNLLIGELQFLPPCMRSEAYVNILRYVDSLKQKHRKKVNN